MEATSERPFFVALVDAPRDLPSALRIGAERRYGDALERALGGTAAVAAGYRAWIQASEDEGSTMTVDLANQVLRWQRAADAARSAGLQDLGDIGPEAHFEVRLASTR